jgi:hypothetical protein
LLPLCNKLKMKSLCSLLLLLNRVEIAAEVRALLMNFTLKEGRRRKMRNPLSLLHKHLFSKCHSDLR